MVSRRYDKERGIRYKKWWARQSGPPKGELIKIPKEVWLGSTGLKGSDQTAQGGGS